VIAAAKRFVLALVFVLPVAALVMPPAPAHAQGSGVPNVHEPTGKKGKKGKKGDAKKAKKKQNKTQRTTTG